jgi:hypothetical protein
MVDIVLLAGKFLLLALVYLFLFAAVRAGIGVVRRGSVGREKVPALKVVAGPREIRKSVVPVRGPIIIGRASGSDICIADDFVSNQHARVTPSGMGVIVEDLQSTNGTVVNGHRVTSPMKLSSGDTITLGDSELKVVEA